MLTHRAVPLTKDDLQPFADIGSEVEGPDQEDGTDARWTFSRNAEEITVSATNDRYTVKGDEAPQRFRSAGAMLASSTFGDLGRWADNQAKLLDLKLDEKRVFNPIPVHGTLKEGIGDQPSRPLTAEAFHDWLVEPVTDRSRLVVIDGPAGVGKSTILWRLAHKRATGFRTHAHPLVLHIESGGKPLQGINDLIASALQDIRANLLYYQMTPLVRHGVVSLAIDGFDELVDPRGYGTAWGQLNDLVAGTRGMATILLAGRETMVSLGRVDEALPAIQTAEGDTLSRLSLQDPEPPEARRWLRDEHDWTDETFSAAIVEPIFEEGSYGLRPFFLAEIGPLKELIEADASLEHGDVEDDRRFGEDLLVFLVRNMLYRETEKFGPEIKAEISVSALYDFIQNFLREVARELRESNASAIAEDNLRLCAETAALVIDDPSPDIIPLLVNRAEVIAFLGRDIRRGYRRFTHEKLLTHFLSEDCIQCVGHGEVPKYVRRNIWGRDDLDSFARVARTCGRAEALAFSRAARKAFDAAGSGDRSRQNLVSLSLVMHCVGDLPDDEACSSWSDVGMSEVLFPSGDVPAFSFSNVVINVLHAERADFTAVALTNSSVMTIHVDDKTVPPAALDPDTVEDRDGQVRRRPDARAWVVERTGFDVLAKNVADGVPQEVIDLLDRIERYAPFWLRDDQNTDDRASRKILNDLHWPTVREVLRKHGRFRQEYIPSSGSRSPFLHFIRSEIPLTSDTELLRELQT